MTRHFSLLFSILFFSLACSPSSNVIDRLQKNTQEQNLNSFASCLTRGTDQLLSIGSWNLKDFPKRGDITVDAVAKTIDELNWDVIALQEMTSKQAFRSLQNKLNDLTDQEIFQGSVTTNSFFSLGILFNQQKLELIGTPQELFSEDRFAFPRPALYLKLRVKETGRVFGVMNVHLKCCRGANNTARRTRAIQLIDQFTRAQNEGVVILGDFNHDIIPHRADSPYRLFLDDNFYRVADLSIATGETTSWSYPRGPFHLDHIILSGELNELKVSIATHPLDQCRTDYFDIFSDHRPIGVELIP